MTAFIYLRVSTDEQDNSGLGLEAQDASCRKIAVSLGFSSPSVESETISGASEIEDRPKLSLILSQIKKGDVLIVAKRDRIAREPRLIGLVEWTLKNRKATLYSAAGEGSGIIDEYDVSGLMQRRMFDLFAEIERAMIRTRTRDALRAKKARGERVGSVEYGFRLKPDDRHVLEDKGLPKCRPVENDGSLPCKGCLNLEPNPDEERVISKIHELARNLSTRKIASSLNEAAILSRTGNPWTKTQITRILKKQCTNSSL